MSKLGSQVSTSVVSVSSGNLTTFDVMHSKAREIAGRIIRDNNVILVTRVPSRLTQLIIVENPHCTSSY